MEESMREFGRFGPLVGAIDAGTSKVRFLVFAAYTSEVLTYHQIPLRRFSPQEEWVEQDPLEILDSVKECINVTADNLKKLDINPDDIVSVGVTNQRETTIVWNCLTEQPLYSAIVWLDGRTSRIVEELKCKGLPNANAVARVSGLPLSTYFTSVKLKWLIRNVPAVQDAIDRGVCMAGTLDSWIIWNLTGGKQGGVHVTDCTNASRTQLMSLSTLKWDERLLRYFDIPALILPEIKSSSEIYGYITEGALLGVPIAGCLGDQQAALVGQGCLKFGQAKCTYGTGCFLLFNTGDSIVHSDNGLLTTVAYKMGANAPTIYALEGSVAIAGEAIEWLKNCLGVKEDVTDTQNSSHELSEQGSVCFVPAFTGLYAPYWTENARGIICGISEHTTEQHLSQAALEAVCHQVREIAVAQARDCGVPLQKLLVDGAMTVNQTLMQMQADILGIPLIRPLMWESASLGVACAAGRAVGVWPAYLPAAPADVFLPSITNDDREIKCEKWSKAVQRSVNWSKEEVKKHLKPKASDESSTLASIPSSLFFLGAAVLIIVADKLAKL